MKSNKFLLAATALLLSFGAFSQQSDTTKKDTAARKTDSTKMDTTKKSSPDLQSTSTNSQGQQQGTTQPSTTVTGTGSTNTSGAGATTTSGAGATTTTGAGATTITGTGTTTTTGTGATTSSMGSGTTAGNGSSTVSTTPKPNFGRYYIPVLGTYNATSTSAATTAGTATASTSVKVTPDESNPGKVWVEGLSASRFYALLKTAPGTYKIPAQKADDMTVAEGTLIYDDNSKQITVCTGCGYNEQAPAVADELATSTETNSKPAKKGQQNMKTKKVPVVTFTGTKADQGTVSILQ